MSRNAFKEREKIKQLYGGNPEFLREYAKQYYTMGWKLATLTFVGYFLLPVGLVLMDIYNNGSASTMAKISNAIDGLRIPGGLLIAFGSAILISAALFYSNRSERRSRAIYEMLADIEEEKEMEKRVEKVEAIKHKPLSQKLRNKNLR